MTDDVIAERMAALRTALAGGGECCEAGRVLWDALSVVLKIHRKSERVLHEPGCYSHAGGSQPGCPACDPEVGAEICAGCRDWEGRPLPFEECWVRQVVLGKLTGGEKAGG